MAKSKNTILASLLTAAGDIAVSGSGSLTGDLTVQGRLTAQEYHSEIVSSSILYTSGSTKFGDSADDTHQFTGSLNVSGSILVNGVAAIGPQGATGSQGATGVQGSTGFQGATGIQGSIGPQGNQGPIGPQGTTGAQGDRGFQGFTGTQGNQGPTGLQGATGVQGATGAQGFQGTTGAQGTAGSLDAVARTGDTMTGQLNGTSAVFTSSVSATGLFGYILKGRSSDNYGAFGFYSNNGATRYGYIQTHSTNGGQFVINGDGGGQITLDSRGIVGTGAVTFSSWLSIGGGSEGLRLGNVGDNSSYDNVKLYYTGYNSASPRVYLTPRTGPGSGIVNTYFHLQNTNGTSTSANNTMGLLVDGSVGIGTTTPPNTKVEILSRAADADRTLPHNILTLTAEQGNAPYGPFGGAILFKNRSYVSGLVESSRIRSVIYDDGAPNNFGGGLWFETTPTPGGTLTPSLVINYQGRVAIGTNTPVEPLTVSYAAHGLISQHRQSNGVGVGQNFYMKFNNSVDAAVNYAGIYADIQANTNGAHSGRMILQVANAGNLLSAITISNNGATTFSNTINASGSITTTQSLFSTKAIVAGEATPLHLSYASSDGVGPAVRLGSGAQGFWDIQPSSNNQRLSFEWQDSVNALSLFSDGNVSIGTNSSNSNRLYVSGNIYSTDTLFARNVKPEPWASITAGSPSGATIPYGYSMIAIATPCDNNWRSILTNLNDTKAYFWVTLGDAASKDTANYFMSMTSPAYGVSNFGNVSYQDNGWNTGGFEFTYDNLGNGTHRLLVRCTSYYNSGNTAYGNIYFLRLE
jgi:hypothetical protein